MDFPELFGSPVDPIASPKSLPEDWHLGSADEVSDGDLPNSDSSQCGVVHDSADGSSCAQAALSGRSIGRRLSEAENSGPEGLPGFSSSDVGAKFGSGWEVSSCSVPTEEQLTGSDWNHSPSADGATKFTDSALIIP